MPQRRSYAGGAYPQAQDMGEWFNLGRMIRDQVTGEEQRKQAMAKEFEGLELEDAQARVMELKGRQRRQQIQDQLAAQQLNRQGDIQAAQSMEGVSGMSVPPQPVRGIQIPQAGINVPGFQMQPQTQEMNLERIMQEQAIKNTVPVPPELQNLDQIIPGMPKLPAEMNEGVLDIITRLVSQMGQTGRQDVKLEHKTGERVATQQFKTGERKETQQFKTGERVAGQEFETEEQRKKRESIEAQKTQDRASREKIAKMKGKGGDGDTAALNRERAMFGLEPIGPQEKKAEGVRAKGNGKKMNVDLAKKYLEEAGGDKEKARKWAKEDGWEL